MLKVYYHKMNSSPFSFSDNATEQATHISTNQTENIHNFMFILPIT